MDKNAIIPKVLEIILKHAKPERVYLHGSQASGDTTPGSDIDIAFDDKEFRDLESIKTEIEELGTLIKIDVTNLAFTEERFRNRVKSTGKVLYSASKKMRAEDGLYNFTRALARLQESAVMQTRFIDEGFESGFCDLVVKRFEFTYEMFWKAIKRYLDAVGITATNPRACYKEAFAQGLILEQAIWLDIIESRNFSSHVYDADQVRPILNKIAAFTTAFLSLKSALEENLKKI